MGMEMQENYRPSQFGDYTPDTKRAVLGAVDQALSEHLEAAADQDPAVQRLEYELAQAEAGFQKWEAGKLPYPGANAPARKQNAYWHDQQIGKDWRAARDEIGRKRDAERTRAKNEAAAKLHAPMQQNAGGETVAARDLRRAQAEETAAREHYLATGLQAGGDQATLLTQWPGVWARLQMEAPDREQATAEANRQDLLRSGRYGL